MSGGPTPTPRGRRAPGSGDRRRGTAGAASPTTEATRRFLALTHALAGARTRAEVARVALRHGRAAVGAPRGWLFVIDTEGTGADLVAASGYARATRGMVRRISLTEERPAAIALRTGEEVWVEDLAATRPIDTAVAATGSRASVAMPLVHDGRCVGVLGFSYLEPHAWGDDDRPLIRAIAGLVAQALERVLFVEAREAERRRQLANQAYLAEASAVLASSLDWESTLRTIARLSVPRIADWCSIELLDGGELRQLVVEHRDPAKAQLARDLRRRYPIDLASDLGSAGVVRTGTAQLIPEIPQPLIDAAATTEELRVILRELGLRSMMCVPLRGRSGTIGAITFVGEAASGRRFGPEDLVIAEALAVRASSAIENARLYRDADRFRRMVDAHTDAVLLFDPDTLAVRYANHGAAVAAGRSEADLVGSSAGDLFEDTDAERLHELVRPITEGRTEARTLVLRLAGAHGSVPMEVLVQGVRLPGEPLAALAIARDVSERLETAARLRRLAEAEHARAAELNAVIRAMGDGVLVCAADGAVTLANPAVARVLGTQGAPATYAALLDRLADPYAAPSPGARGGPVELRLAGDEERWVELATYPVGTVPGNDRHETIVVVRDVTEARASQALRETFVGVLSHELRTPITTIFGGSKLLARDTLDEAHRRAIFADIHVEAERLHRLVEDVIALTRFGEDGIEIGHEPVLLQRILPSIVEAERARWPEAEFTLELPSGLPTVVADPTYVEQVVRNLLSNAAKYGGAGVHVHTAAETDGETVSVRITDDGPGFAEEDASRLFDLYFRSPNTAANVSGAGIGLFVCARLIRAMGGRIWAKRRAGGGAEFGFALERMADDADG